MGKTNIAELLKDCPKGMELDCTMFDNIYLERVDKNVEYPIVIRVGKTDIKYLTKEGCWNKNSNAKCVIFPKGKTTWEGFIPFVKGDIIYTDGFVAILFNITGSGTLWYYCCYSISEDRCKIKKDFGIGNVKDNELRFATEEEKQRLFDAIKANGYKWNAETKTLEEIKKFDINTLKPFESRVLVRDGKNLTWKPAIFGYHINNISSGFCVVGGLRWYECIPYEGNEHLLGTTDDCDEYFKTWKK